MGLVRLAFRAGAKLAARAAPIRIAIIEIDGSGSRD